MRLRALILAALLAALPAAAGAGPDIDPLIGARVPPETALTDATGAERSFADLLDPRGTLLVMGYHRCPNLCGVLQQQLAEILSRLPDSTRPTVLFASLDPAEGPPDARAMRARLADAAPDANLTTWRFLTGEPQAIAALTRPLGLTAWIRPGGDVIVHPAAVGVLTPDGALSEVFYGFDFPPSQLRTALDRAAEGHVGGLRQRIVLLCSAVDEAVGRVARAALTGIRGLAALTVLALAAALVLLWRREAR